MFYLSTNKYLTITKIIFRFSSVRLELHGHYFIARHIYRTVISRRVLLKYIKINKTKHECRAVKLTHDISETVMCTVPQ
jgi:hypothetical protein